MPNRALNTVMGTFLIIALTSLLVSASSASINLTASPDPIARWDYLTYHINVTNNGSPADITLEDNLPSGLDQCNATYSINGSTWHTLPPYGMISLGTLSTGETVSVEIKARVQTNAPATLSNTVNLTDGSKKLDSDTLVINVLPSVDAGPDIMIGLGETTVFSDAWVKDGQGQITEYTWKAQPSGIPAGTFVDPSVIHPTYTAPTVSGTVKMTLTATDSDAGQSSDSFWLSVNSFPIANAGTNKSVNETEKLILTDASAIDSDGYIVYHKWEDNGSGGTFDNSEKLHAVYTAPDISKCAGEDVILTLTVTDNLGATSTDQVEIHIENINHLPKVDAGNDQNVKPGDPVTLYGKATDVDGQISGVIWEQIEGQSVILSHSNELQATFTAPITEQTLEFSLTATDTCSGEASDQITIHVQPAIQSPTPSKKPAISIQVDADPAIASLGDSIVYVYTVMNSGELPLEAIELLDSQLGQVDLEKDTLAPGEITQGVEELTVHIDLFPGPQRNTATVTGQTKSNKEVTDSTECSVSLHYQSAGIQINLGAQDCRGFPISPFDPLHLGDKITYEYRITNTGESPLHNLRLTDGGSQAIPLSSTKIGPWESMSGHFTVEITQQDLPGPFEQTVMLCASDLYNQQLEASDTLVLYGLSSHAELQMEKTCNVEKAAIGQIITYRYSITNVGTSTILELALKDDHLGEISLPARAIAPGETMVTHEDYKVSRKDLPGPLTNTASITGSGLEDNATSSSSSVTIEITQASAGGGGSTSNSLNGKIIINEIAWAGTSASPADEWIELRNLGSTPVDLTGWSIVWYAKKEITPPEDQWTRVTLTGTISPSPLGSGNPNDLDTRIAFIPSSNKEWRVMDTSWWIAGKREKDGRGYYLLERRSQDTVSDVIADLIYDESTTYKYILPDKGAVILLIDDQGNIADTANAERAGVPGWPAGDVNTCATMERTDPLGEDLDANWHTNPGILTKGHDASYNRLIATAGAPNSPSLNQLTLLAQENVSLIEESGKIEMTIPGDGKPHIKVAAVGLTPAVGGGGTATGLAFSTHFCMEESSLSIETSALTTGKYYIWITNSAGESTLVPLLVK